MLSLFQPFKKQFMRYIVLLFLGVFGIANLQAQVQEIPLQHNSVVYQHWNSQQKDKIAARQSFIERHQFSSLRSDLIQEDNQYIISGDTLTFCRDTSFLTGAGGSFDLLECDPIGFGMVSIDSTCITYASNAGITLASDTICVEFCRTTNDCDTLQFPIIIKRPNGCIPKPLVSIAAETSTTNCVDADTMGLPGTFQSIELIDDSFCGDVDDQLTEVTLAGFCVLYEASALADTDELCVLICDDATVCDTLKLNYEVTQDTISLNGEPFFDDFNYAGPYPNRTNWLTDDVFVNSTMAINPPSIGVATFDGVGPDGSPYAVAAGPSDYLTSVYLDLSGMTPDPSFQLSYFIQAGGCGNIPEEDDEFRLEFKTQDGEWNIVDVITASMVADSAFIYRSIPFNTNEFLYAGFQFRFVNLSSNTGFLDHWNLDYVYLGDQASSTPEDVAFTAVPNDILNPYTSMPWHHFEVAVAEEIDYSFQIEAHNLAGADIAIGSSLAEIHDAVSGSNLYTGTTIFDPFDSTAFFEADERKIFDRALQNTAPYISNLQNINTDPVIVETIYSLTLSSQLDQFKSNDEVIRQTTFGNYFAYDDGSAEGSINAQGAGTQIAIQFHTNVDDSLNAVQVHIPHINIDVSEQLFRLKVVFEDLEAEPVYESIDLVPLYLDEFQESIQGFTVYQLKDELGAPAPVFLPANTNFYIIWEQITNEFNEAIPLGFDKNSPSGAAHSFFKTPTMTEWATFPSTLSGAVMLRPVVGDNTVFTTAVEEQEINNTIRLYPNPTAGWINVALEKANYQDFDVEIYTSSGQLVQSGSLNNRLELNGFVNGLYFVKIIHRKTREISHHRVILTK